MMATFVDTPSKTDITNGPTNLQNRSIRRIWELRAGRIVGKFAYRPQRDSLNLVDGIHCHQLSRRPIAIPIQQSATWPMNNSSTQSLPMDIAFMVDDSFSTQARKVTHASRNDLWKPSSMGIMYKKIAHDMATAIL